MKIRQTYNEIMIAVKDYLGNKCVYCGTIKDVHIHHILPLSRGGQNTLGNFELVCVKCHSRIHQEWKKIYPLKDKMIEINCKKCGERLIRKINYNSKEGCICKNCREKNLKIYSKKRYSERKNRLNKKGFIKIWIIIVCLMVMMSMVEAWIKIYAKTPPQAYYGFTELYLEAPRVPYYPVSGYEEIISCLIKYESGGNEMAIGDSGKAKGILQFHQPTFEQYCVREYGWRNDIMDSEIQIGCVSEMLDEDFDNIYHWSVWDLCI